MSSSDEKKDTPEAQQVRSSSHVVKRMDVCDSLTVDICDLVSKRQENIDEAFNDQLDKDRLKADNEVKVAAARVRVYNNFDGLESFEEETDHKTQYGWQDAGLRTPLNPQAMPFQPHPAPSKAPVTQEEVSLAQAIASSLTLSRLPVPEPTTFTEKAYQGAWAVLQDRYGSPFIVRRAFRDKLMKWPKIAANDSIALREFADFLQGCVEAIPHVKGLEFMQTEARIACNPIVSSLLMNVKNTDERLPKRAKALSTSTQMKNSTSGTLEKPKTPCLVCKDETHARGLNSKTYIQLQQIYIRDSIPVDKSHIATKSTALQWPHLKQLKNKLHPLQDCEVGLLIGYDCLSALVPLEVITDKENEPFAERTMLGWSIIGSANPHLDRH
ncbi:Laminin subunit alpha-5 [Labeo rohita]|uniref:Laminin subunit alpha-5 n=1 Tax=Labeo rohita TaxID=84645 RepID=A0ABQ8L4K5_LABRO|nr:Laminin subunit alpha-5 [Labeo rohita]